MCTVPATRFSATYDILAVSTEQYLDKKRSNKLSTNFGKRSWTTFKKKEKLDKLMHEFETAEPIPNHC